jgi:hypothetical protein
VFILENEGRTREAISSTLVVERKRTGWSYAMRAVTKDGEPSWRIWRVEQ